MNVGVDQPRRRGARMVEGTPQASPPCCAPAQDVGQHRRIARCVGVDRKALDRAVELEMEPRSALRLDRFIARHPTTGRGDPSRFDDRVRDRAAALGGRQVQPIGDRAAPVDRPAQSGEADLDPHQATDVARVAVRVPTTGVDDRHRPTEVVVAPQEAQDHQAVIRDDVDVPVIPLIPVRRRRVVRVRPASRVHQPASREGRRSPRR